MPYTDTVGDIVRMTSAAFYADNQLEEFNIHYVCSISGGADSRPTLAAYNDTHVAANLIPTMDAGTVHYGTKVSLVKTATPSSPVVTTPATAGTVTDKVAPTQCRGIVSIKTGMSGRKFRGRIYIYTPAITMITNDSAWSSTFGTAMFNYTAAVLVPILAAGSTWSPVIVGYTHKPTVVVRSNLVVSHAVSLQIATQRRASRYGRPNSLPW